MHLRGRNLVDLGAGDGRVMASAMKCGARSVVGYELPANSAHKFVYDAVLRRIFAGIDLIFYRRLLSGSRMISIRFFSISHCVNFSNHLVEF